MLQVNCAGILELGSIENTSLEQFDRMFNINVRYVTVAYFVYHCDPYDGGYFINVSVN